MSYRCRIDILANVTTAHHYGVDTSLAATYLLLWCIVIANFCDEAPPTDRQSALVRDRSQPSPVAHAQTDAESVNLITARRPHEQLYELLLMSGRQLCELISELIYEKRRRNAPSHLAFFIHLVPHTTGHHFLSTHHPHQPSPSLTLALLAQHSPVSQILPILDLWFNKPAVVDSNFAPDAVTWQTGLNMRVVSDSGPLAPLCEQICVIHKPGST